ncbi:MAG: transglutaminaseTgpA domain-containing protein [Acidimicrobiales bacterium]
MAGGRQQAALDAGAAGCVTGLVVPSILPLFAGGGAPWLVLAAAVPTVVAAVSVLLRTPGLNRPWVRFGADVIGAAIVVAIVPGGSGSQSALGGLPSGAAQLITSALPASVRGPELGFVVVTLAIAAGLAGELALRTDATLLPLAPALVLYGAAVAVGAGGIRTPTWGAILLVGGAAAAALIRRQRPLGMGDAGDALVPVIAGGRRSPFTVSWRRLGAGVAAAGVVTAVALPLGTHLPGAGARRPYDLRAAVQPAPRVPDQPNPLVTYASIYDGPPQPVFSVRATGADPRDLYWRLDTLDHFTGPGWTSTASLLRGGSTLPPGPLLTVATTKVVATVTLQGPQRGRAVYLPAPDRPTHVSIAGLDVSPADAVLAVPPGTASPTQYVVTASKPSPSKRELLAAGSVFRPDPGSPAPSPLIQSTATAIVGSASASPFARLTAISTYLTGAPFVRHPPEGSPLGSGTYQVMQLLMDHDGSDVQYAAAFALLARSVGFDVRLAVGYLGGTSAASGAVDFSTRDLSVWPEVLLAGIGWLPWPTVPGTGSPSKSPAAQPSSPISQAIAEQRNLNASAPPAASAPPRPVVHPARPSGAVAWTALVAVVLALVVVAGLVIAAAKAGRRQRQRRRIDPRQRVAGAWECVLDRLAELGVNVAPALTVPEVVERAVTRVGPKGVGPLPKLVRVIDASRYDRQFPPSPAMADSAWAQTLEVERSLRASVPVARRLRAVLSPAPWRR